MEFKKSFASTIALIFVASVVVFPIPLTAISESDDEWELVMDGEDLVVLVQGLEEYCWELARPPYGPWDKIALRRLVKIDEESIGTIFIFPGTWSSGDQVISSDDFYQDYLEAIGANEKTREELSQKIANHSIAHYLAIRGFDVYSIDYRTHYVPMTSTQSDLGFMKNWGWEMYIEDAKLAFEKAKEASGKDKMFLGGMSFGGMLAMNYASVYWEEDLEGIVLLDGGNGGRSDPVELISNIIQIPIPLLERILDTAFIGIPLLGPFLKVLTHFLGVYALDKAGDLGPILNTMPLPLNSIPDYPEVIEYAKQHPLEPPLDPVTGEVLEPAINPVTGEPSENYLEWLGGSQASSELASNIQGGYNDLKNLGLVALRSDRYWPIQIYLEHIADLMRPGYRSDGGIWNRDYFNFYAHYSEIDVPLIAFISRFGLMMWGEFDPEIKNQDVTGYTLTEFGHLDIYSGTYNDVMVIEPTYQWLLDHIGG